MSQLFELNWVQLGSVNDGKQAQQNQRIVFEIAVVPISEFLKFESTEFRSTKRTANLKLVADEKAIKL